MGLPAYIGVVSGVNVGKYVPPHGVSHINAGPQVGRCYEHVFPNVILHLHNCSDGHLQQL